jgi:hypothetical protein
MVYERNTLYMEVIDLDDGAVKYFPLWRMIGVLANWRLVDYSELETQPKSVAE